MRRDQEIGPGEDGEERGSSPSSSSGGGRSDRVARGFAVGGSADVMEPGPGLAGRLTAVTSGDGAASGPDGAASGALRGLSDQEVLGVLGAAGRMAAWSAWVELTALAEFARRRPSREVGPRFAKEAAEEVAWKTGESWHRMIEQTSLAASVTARLPQTMAALRRGLLTEYKLRIIEGQTAHLSDENAAKADVILAAAGQVKNPAALRDYARRLVNRLDPEAARSRKERARKDAHAIMWREDSGNAGLSAREMPATDAVLAWQNIERRALDLHAAGVVGTTGQLQVQAVLDFLLGRAIPGGPACQNARGVGRGVGRGGGRGGWAVNPVLIVPWDPGRGRPSGDADLPGFGPLDESDTMDLLAAAGRSPQTRWCVTVTGPDGTAAGHGCAPGRHTLDDLTTARTSQDCDQDNTTAWDDGGITCECDLAPLCRYHHQVKQARGWRLEQPEPGVLVWTSPAGLTRTTRPSSYLAA